MAGAGLVDGGAEGVEEHIHIMKIPSISFVIYTKRWVKHLSNEDFSPQIAIKEHIHIHVFACGSALFQ